VEIPRCVYRPRDPRKTPLFGLLDSLYDRVKGVWEERFERSYGFWRGPVDEVVARCLDCGILDRGFARIRCRRCPEEFLVAFSCKGRGVCPSCGAKRAAELAAFLQEEVVEEVGHAQWVFTVPKMLRVYFLHHRELLGGLSRAAYETVKELMVTAVAETEGERIDAMEFVARVLVQIPDPRRHLVRYYGAYSNVARGKRGKAETRAESSASSEASMVETTPEGADRAALRRRWADLIRRVYEVDPLVCPRCGGEMRVVGFITEPSLIKRILDHLRKREKGPRPPPRAPQPVASPVRDPLPSGPG